ncbi:MAG TPA: hypothetical protein VFP86_16010 [bacterium]|nr:hypothetical protein [bacterium]
MNTMAEEKPEAPKDSTPQAPAGEMSREEKIAAAKAKAEALKAQRAAAGTPAPAAAAVIPGAPAAATRPAPAQASAQRSWATADNPGGQAVVAPQNPKIQAFGTITQSVELRCEPSEDQNVRKLLGGLGAYRNPLRGVWQLDYRYYAEALKRLLAAGYQVDGKDYLGRPLEKWTPEGRGWTLLTPG